MWLFRTIASLARRMGADEILFSGMRAMDGGTEAALVVASRRYGGALPVGVVGASATVLNGRERAGARSERKCFDACGWCGWEELNLDRGLFAHPLNGGEQDGVKTVRLEKSLHASLIGDEDQLYR
jgi:hypothetical protein